MGIQAQSAAIAASLLLAIAINVAFQERRVEHRFAFVWLTAAFFSYNLAVFFDDLTGAPGWRRALLASGVGVALASLSFFRAFIGRSLGAPRHVLQGLAFAVGVVLVTDLALSPVVAALVASVSLGAYGFAHWQLYRHWRAAESPVEIRRLRYLVVGGAGSVISSGLDLLPASGLPFPSFGHLFTTVYLYFWMQVIQRSRLLDLREQLGRGLALLLQALVVSVIFVALVIWVDHREARFLFNTLVAGVILSFVHDPLKRAVEHWVRRLFFHETHALDAELAGLQRELAHVLNLGDLVERVLDRLQASRRITHASVFLLEDEGRAYFLARSLGPLNQSRLGVVHSRHFLAALREGPVLVLDRVERERQDLLGADPARQDALQAILETMRDLSADLSFPLRSGDRLLGFLNLRDDRAREAFSSGEIERIRALTRQMATIVENSELIERLKDRERLSLIGELATGLAHEIRNPLGAIKAAGQLLEPDHVDEEQRELLSVIIEETDRLNGVVSQFLDYARPFKGALAPVDLERLLQRVATLIRAEPRVPPVEVGVQVERDLPQALGDADRLQQVLLNLARNGCEAMAQTGGQLTLAARLDVDAERIRVEVRDEGCGVSPEVRANLFTPFFTTKRDGTGLGLAITERILQHHGARIRVETQPERGALFSFRLRLATDHAPALTGEHRRRLAAKTA